MEHVISILRLTFWESGSSKHSLTRRQLSHSLVTAEKSPVATLWSMLGFQDSSNLLIFAYHKMYSNHHFCSSLVATNPLLHLWAGLTLQVCEHPASHSLIVLDITQAVTHISPLKYANSADCLLQKGTRFKICSFTLITQGLASFECQIVCCSSYSAIFSASLFPTASVIYL